MLGPYKGGLATKSGSLGEAPGSPQDLFFIYTLIFRPVPLLTLRDARSNSFFVWPFLETPKKSELDVNKTK